MVSAASVFILKGKQVRRELDEQKVLRETGLTEQPWFSNDIPLITILCRTRWYIYYIGGLSVVQDACMNLVLSMKALLFCRHEVTRSIVCVIVLLPKALKVFFAEILVGRCMCYSWFLLRFQKWRRRILDIIGPSYRHELPKSLNLRTLWNLGRNSRGAPMIRNPVRSLLLPPSPHTTFGARQLPCIHR